MARRPLLDVPSEYASQSTTPLSGEVCYPAPSKRRGISSNTASAARHFVEHSPAVGQKLPCQTCVSAARSSRLRTILRRGYRANRFDRMRGHSRGSTTTSSPPGGSPAERRPTEIRESRRATNPGLDPPSLACSVLGPPQILGGCYTASARFCRNGR
jgi:hypothetical protein